MPSPDGPAIDALIDAGRESANLEYKQSEPWERLSLQIVKAALAFANTRGGGHIVIGMKRLADDQYEAEGMVPDHLRTYRLDHVQAQVNRYADPAVSLDGFRHEHDGKIFFVIAVDEFEDVPVICRGGSEDGALRQAAIYVRSRRMNASAPIDNQTDMRALLARATEKALAARLQELARAGVVQLAVADVLSSTGQFTAGQFERERGDL